MPLSSLISSKWEVELGGRPRGPQTLNQIVDFRTHAGLRIKVQEGFITYEEFSNLPKLREKIRKLERDNPIISAPTRTLPQRASTMHRPPPTVNPSEEQPGTSRQITPPSIPRPPPPPLPRIAQNSTPIDPRVTIERRSFSFAPQHPPPPPPTHTQRPSNPESR